MTHRRRVQLQRIADPANNASPNEQAIARRLLAEDASVDAPSWSDVQGWTQGWTRTAANPRSGYNPGSQPWASTADEDTPNVGGVYDPVREEIRAVIEEIRRHLPDGWRFASVDLRYNEWSHVVADGVRIGIKLGSTCECDIVYGRPGAMASDHRVYIGSYASVELVRDLVDFIRRKAR